MFINDRYFKNCNPPNYLSHADRALVDPITPSNTSYSKIFMVVEFVVCAQRRACTPDRLPEVLLM